MQLTKKHKTHINTDESTHSERGPVWQNPIQRTATIRWRYENDGRKVSVGPHNCVRAPK